jgi:hypothetical protein
VRLLGVTMIYWTDDQPIYDILCEAESPKACIESKGNTNLEPIIPAK